MTMMYYIMPFIMFASGAAFGTLVYHFVKECFKQFGYNEHKDGNK